MAAVGELGVVGDEADAAAEAAATRRGPLGAETMPVKTRAQKTRKARGSRSPEESLRASTGERHRCPPVGR